MNEKTFVLNMKRKKMKEKKKDKRKEKRKEGISITRNRMSSSMPRGGSPLAEVQPILLRLGNSQLHHNSNNLHLLRN